MVAVASINKTQMRQVRGDARSVLIKNRPREQRRRPALLRPAAGKWQGQLHRSQPARSGNTIHVLVPVVHSHSFTASRHALFELIVREFPSLSTERRTRVQ